MTRALALLVLAPLALAACTPNATSPMPSGGSAGAMGDAYCETPPSDPADQANWEQLCMPDSAR